MAPNPTFVHITDLHIGDPGQPDDHLFSNTSATLERVMTMIAAIAPRPDFIIASGDLTNRGRPEDYHELRRILAATDIPLVLALGNHDTRPGFYAGMQIPAADPQAPYDHDCVLAGIHIITLDSSSPGEIGGTIEEAQFAWLEDRLNARPDLPKLLVSHHAPSLGTEPDWDFWRVIDFDQSQRLAQMLRGHNVQAILSGHIHHDRFSVWNGIPVIVGMGQHAATDILETSALRMVEGASFGIGTLRPTGLTMALVPLPSARQELNRYDYTLLRQRLDQTLASRDAR